MLGNPVDDHRSLQIKTLHEVPALLPVDEGPCRPQGGEALADLGCDGVIACLRGQFQSQAPLDLGIAVREFDEDRGKALGAESHKVVQSDGLLRRHALSVPRRRYTVNTVEPVVFRLSRSRCASAASFSG